MARTMMASKIRMTGSLPNMIYGDQNQTAMLSIRERHYVSLSIAGP